LRLALGIIVEIICSSQRVLKIEKDESVSGIESALAWNYRWDEFWSYS